MPTNVAETIHGRRAVIATFATFAEAFAFVENRNPVCLEADADHPGYADAFMASGVLLVIEPAK